MVIMYQNKNKNIFNIYKILIIIIFNYFNLIKFYNCINILGIVTSSSKSNNLHASALFDALVNDGHSVRVLSPHSQSPKIYHLKLDGFEKSILDINENLWITNSNNNNNEPQQQQQQQSYSKNYFHTYEKGLERTKAIIQHRSFKKLLTSSYTVDIIIIDYDYNEALFGLARYFNCPIIILYSGQIEKPLRYLLNLPYPFNNIKFHEIIHNNNNINDNDNKFYTIIDTFKEIINDFIEELYINFYYHPSQKRLYESIFIDKSIYHQYSDISKVVHDFNFDDIRKKSIAKIFISLPPLKKSNLMLTDIVDVTGFHLNTFKKFNYDHIDNSLDQKINNKLNDTIILNRLDNFIHNENTDCIYVSFGIDYNINNILPKLQLNTILNVLQERNEKIIWSWNGNITSFIMNSKFINLNNIFIDKWLPQNYILKHTNVKLMISNCGILSLIETIMNEIPVICIPITIKQSNMIDSIIVNYNLGIKLLPKNLSSISLKWAINEILENEKYRNNLYIKSQEIYDRPLTPIKNVKYWINWVYRYRHNYRYYDKINNNLQFNYDNNYHKLDTKDKTPTHLEYYILNTYMISLIILVIIVILIYIIIMKILYNLIIYLITKRRKLKIY